MSLACLMDEDTDLISHPEELFPLFSVKRDRESPEPVDGQSTFLADSERHLPSCRLLQRFVLGAKPFNFLFQILFRWHQLLIAHADTPPACTERSQCCHQVVWIAVMTWSRLRWRTRGHDLVRGASAAAIWHVAIMPVTTMRAPAPRLFRLTRRESARPLQFSGLSSDSPVICSTIFSFTCGR